MESSTQVLCRLLDDRKVEYETDNTEMAYHVRWQANGMLCNWVGWHDLLTPTLNVYGLTPEQAIAATLGAGTCKLTLYEDTGITVCSECGAVQPDDWTVYYCWSCGRRVVEVNE